MASSTHQYFSKNKTRADITFYWGNRLDDSNPDNPRKSFKTLTVEEKEKLKEYIETCEQSFREFQESLQSLIT